MLNRIGLYPALCAVARAVDLVHPALKGHHVRTAVLFMRIAKELGFSAAQCRTGFIAAMLHDTGGLSEAARLAPLAAMDTDVSTHARTGGALLRRIPFLQEVSDVVTYHHTWWCKRTTSVPAVTHALYLADRVDVMLNTGIESDYLVAAERVKRTVKTEAGDRFCPRCVEAFLHISQPASFWLSLESSWYHKSLDLVSPLKGEGISLREFHQLAGLLAFVVDTHSRKTHWHSRKVAEMASRLGRAGGSDPVTCLKLSTAGLLHDLGKLAIPAAVLDKAGPLNANEKRLMERHAWLTHCMLDGIPGAEDIALWAGSHHENVEGTGYPYGIPADTLPEECRIVTVADIWCALTETRPYRKALNHDEALKRMFGILTSARDRALLTRLEIITALA